MLATIRNLPSNIRRIIQTQNIWKEIQLCGADVIGIKTKKLPELNDEFAKDVSDATSLDELKTKIKESLEHDRDHRQKDLQREKIIAELIKVNDSLFRNHSWSIRWMRGWNACAVARAARR